MNNLFDQNGYIDVTALCALAGKKKFSHWFPLKRTTRLLSKLSAHLSLTVNELVKVNHGGNVIQHTFVHPMVAVDIGCWISVEYQIKVLTWIEEWKALQDNRDRFDSALKNIKPDETAGENEAVIRDALAETLNGTIEVKTPAGYIDILTTEEIIEVKAFKLWKHAVGQVLMYGCYHPHLGKRIHLFDADRESPLLSEIEKNCSLYNIKVTYE